jgi:pyridoxamine 5'-phosphate oxidase family protein
MAVNTSPILFNEQERAYLASQRLGRLATSSVDGQPHVVPVGFSLREGYIHFSGFNLKGTAKYRQILRNERVAFVVDDLASVDPWTPRMVTIKGIAEPVEIDGSPFVRITPTWKASYGIN